MEEDKVLMTSLEERIASCRYLLEKKQKFKLPAQVHIKSCDHFNSDSAPLLCVGQSNGVFSLFNLDTLESIHSFQISEQNIDTVSINCSGDWIALASK